MKLERKVLFTASTFSHIRSFHLPYLAWFRDRGWEVHAACGGEQAHIPQADRVIALPFEKRMASPKNFRAAAILRHLIRREGYALISTHTSLAAFFTRLAVKGMRDRPKVADIVHGYLFDDDTPALKRGLLLAAERLTAPETDLLLTGTSNAPKSAGWAGGWSASPVWGWTSPRWTGAARRPDAPCGGSLASRRTRSCWSIRRSSPGGKASGC